MKYFLLGLLAMSVACGKDDFVCNGDTVSFDMCIFVSKYQKPLVDSSFLDDVIQETYQIAPKKDKKQFDKLKEVTVYVYDAKDYPGPWESVGETYELDKVNIALIDTPCTLWTIDGCDNPFWVSTGSILAHEIGHAVGHEGHDYRPWFGKDENNDFRCSGIGPIESAVGDWQCGQ